MNNFADDENVRTKTKNIKCCMCGTWIERIHYGGYIDGEYINFIEKASGSCKITLCSECMSKLLYHLETD